MQQWLPTGLKAEVPWCKRKMACRKGKQVCLPGSRSQPRLQLLPLARVSGWRVRLASGGQGTDAAPRVLATRTKQTQGFWPLGNGGGSGGVPGYRPQLLRSRWLGQAPTRSVCDWEATCRPRPPASPQWPWIPGCGQLHRLQEKTPHVTAPKPWG